MKYKIIIHEMLVVYCTTVSFRGGCIYKRVDVIAVRVWCQLSTIILIICNKSINIVRSLVELNIIEMYLSETE